MAQTPLQLAVMIGGTRSSIDQLRNVFPQLRGMTVRETVGLHDERPHGA